MSVDEVQSVVLVPAAGAGQVVTDLRLEYDQSAAAGVPPHLTLMFPFLPARELTDVAVDALGSLIGQSAAFEVSLTRVNQFEQGVVYLEPEPVAELIRLTKEIGRQFGLLPFGGKFGEEPVPHLTVGVVESASVRRKIADQLVPELPITIRAEEAWLMVGTNSSNWTIVRKMRFRDGD